MDVTQDPAQAEGAALTLADGRRLALVGSELYLGRALTNDIVVDDATIAPRHARLEHVSSGWLLTDLASPAGTEVNGQLISRPVFLAPGDAIRLGRVLVVLDANGVAHEPPRLRSSVADDAPPARPRERARRDDGANPWLGSTLITLRNVSKTYDSAAGPLPVLRDVSLTVNAGELVAIVGPSGCGKSTLLNVITGIDQPDSGRVHVAGQDLHELRGDGLARWRGHTVGIVFQFFQLLPTLTVAENVMLPMAFCKTYPGPHRRARALQLLERVGMEQLADRFPTALSGGEQQRVAIARALANDPPLLVADEPTGNLDGRTGRQIFELFRRLVASGTTVLMVTHDAALASQTRRRIEMRDGAIVRVPQAAPVDAAPAELPT